MHFPPCNLMFMGNACSSARNRKSLCCRDGMLDDIRRKRHCCGADSPMDWETAKFGEIPPSCCFVPEDCVSLVGHNASFQNLQTVLRERNEETTLVKPLFSSRGRVEPMTELYQVANNVIVPSAGRSRQIHCTHDEKLSKSSPNYGPRGKDSKMEHQPWKSVENTQRTRILLFAGYLSALALATFGLLCTYFCIFVKSFHRIRRQNTLPGSQISVVDPASEPIVLRTSEEIQPNRK
ncbi:hypothetical protein RvY_15701-1 [Ramazzottius varieornatus]|uniref:Uncharacterized protein n=1 Tax=Ramazzottius varieornatus TaxID=947166 RepID=A0A1D1W3Q6_RAMVA|nr:hypothetical protein RvY_15701-1 [Ramazzottius varieornatus]